MATKDPLFYLVHIRECCERILSYTLRTWEQGGQVHPWWWTRSAGVSKSSARLRRSLDPEFRQAHGEIPWRSVIGTRNLLIHAYDQVDPAVLGGIVERDIPELARAVERMLKQA
jgi:uncharacterized protein with HEPN domain